jgi:hypothetical protein
MQRSGTGTFQISLLSISDQQTSAAVERDDKVTSLVHMPDLSFHQSHFGGKSLDSEGLREGNEALAKAISSESFRSGSNMSVFTGPRSTSAPPSPPSRRGVPMDEDPDDSSELDQDEATEDVGGYRNGSSRSLSSSSGNSSFDGSPQKPELKTPDSMDPENSSDATTAENPAAAAAGSRPTQYPAPASRTRHLDAGGIEEDDVTGASAQVSNIQQVEPSLPYPTAAALPVSVQPVRIRPNPVKTTPPISNGGGVTVVAPVPRAARPTAVPLQPSSPSPQYRPKEKQETQATIVTHQPKPLAIASKKEEDAWCDEATALARQNKEEQKKKKIEEQGRRQEIQCNFPEPEGDSSEFSMPPTNGRASANENMDGDDGTAQYGAQQQQQQQQEGGYQQLHQHQQQQQQVRANNTRDNRANSASSYGGGNRRSNNIHMRGNDDGLAQQPTPLFERLVTEEVQEIKSYVRIIENQSRRLSELERFHGDLEARLEVESRGWKRL